MAEDLTSLVCLFHHHDQARAAVHDLIESGISQDSISTVDHHGSEDMSEGSLQDLGIPDRDCKHIIESLRTGGVLVAVSVVSGKIEAVERAFAHHGAKLIDEADVDAQSPDRGAMIPVVEEELVVGKRTVDQGNVRVYRRIVEIPVEQSVQLREEHVHVQRNAVDRPVTDADLALQGDRTIELLEATEEVVVGKAARVVEEVVVGKSQSEHTEHVHETVRRTEVTVEETAPQSESQIESTLNPARAGRSV